MPDEKEPIPQFAARIKQKYPEYKDIDDTLLTQKIVAKYPEYADMVDLSPMQPSKKKVGSEESGFTFPTTVSEVLSTGKRKTQEDEKNKFIKPLPPQTFQQGVKQDKIEYSMIPEKKGSYWGGVYNTVVDLVSKAVGGGVETLDLMEGTSDQILGKKNDGWREVYDEGGELKTREAAAPQKQLTRQQVEGFIEKARSASSTKENEAARSQLDVTDGIQKEDIEALWFQTPKTVLQMFLGAATGGTTFFTESVSQNAEELEKSGAAKDLSASEKLGYVVLQGTVQAALEKFGIDKILKSTGLSNKLKQKISGEIATELAKKGVKATTQDIERLALQKVSSLSSKVKRVGVKATTSLGAEMGTESLQTLASEGIKLGVNAIKGKEIFDSNDITANLIKNTINAGAMGGVFGGGIGGAVGVLQNTQKGLRNQIAQAQSPEDVAKIQQDINEQVELGNITQEEAEAANITAQQYAEIASKIPQEVDADKKYALIGGIEQREDLKKSIADATEELAATDEAFHQPIQDRIELFNAKLEQTNDYIDGLVTGKKTTYKKSGDEFFKTDAEGNEIPISKLHYELATAIREQDAINNKKPEINPTDQKTFEFDADEDVPVELEKTQPIAIRETEDGKVEATYSGEQLIKAGLAQDNLLSDLRSKAGEFEKGENLQYFIDKAAEAPAQYIEKYGEDATNRLLAKTPTKKLLKNMVDMGKFSKDNPNIPLLEKEIERREAAEESTPTTEDVVPSLKDVDVNKLSEQEKTIFEKLSSSNLTEQVEIDQKLHDDIVGTGRFSKADEQNLIDNKADKELVKGIFNGEITDGESINKAISAIERDKKIHNEYLDRRQSSNTGTHEWHRMWANVYDGWLKKLNEVKQQTKVSPTTEQATQEVLNIPQNWDAVKDTDVEVHNADGSKTKMKFKRAFVDLKKQFKQLDNVLNCI